MERGSEWAGGDERDAFARVAYDEERARIARAQQTFIGKWLGATYQEKVRTIGMLIGLAIFFGPLLYWILRGMFT